MTTHPEPSVAPVQAAVETLMPEPVGFRTRYSSEPEMIGHYPWTYADVERRRRKYDNPECEYEDLYTADQMRQAIQAVSDLAAKREREACAKLCDSFYDDYMKKAVGGDNSGASDHKAWAAFDLAVAIRARDGGTS